VRKAASQTRSTSGRLRRMPKPSGASDLAVSIVERLPNGREPVRGPGIGDERMSTGLFMP
jgi:hypothetical protein